MNSLWRPLVASALVSCLMVGMAYAQPAAPTDNPPSTDATIQALERAHASVVGIEVRATEGARSADTLGRQREGTGVVIGPEPLVLTIGYLTLEAESIQVVTRDGRVVPARTVAYDLATGFALLQPLVPLRDIPPAPLGSLQALTPGAILMTATGAHTDGEASQVGMTRLVGKRSFSGYWEYHIESAAFTSPPLNIGSGNHTGAGLFNPRGELVGIGSLFVLDAAGGGARLPGNMFVPVDLLVPVLAEMRSDGASRASRRPWIGLNSNEQNGRVQVVRVNPDSPAERAGLRPGDVVLAVDGQPVTTLAEFYGQLWKRPAPDSEITLTVLQGVQTQTLKLQGVDRMRTLARPTGI